MTLSKETLMAYVDGELPGEERAQVEAELAVNAEARAYVERQQALVRRMHASFNDILDMPVPSALQEAGAPQRFFQSRLWRLTSWTALPVAGALACGLLIGVMLNGSNVVSRNGMLVARGALADALTQKVAADQSGETRIGISFRDKNGRYCRTFREPTMAGVACRQGGGWAIAAAGNVALETGGEYRQAGSAMPDFLRSTVEAMIVGEPLTADGERKARDARWNARTP